MPPQDERMRNAEVVFDPTQYAFFLDSLKGTVVCHVGPSRPDLAAEKDKPVKFVDGEFVKCQTVDEAIESFPVAREGDYIVLENPSKTGEHPEPGRSNAAVDLEIGRKVVIPGPVSFALWPGQVAHVIKGHHLRSNQYLVARVYNEDQARKNWGQVIARPSEQSTEKPSETTKSGEGAPETQTPATPPEPKEAPALISELARDLTIGKLLIIKGTDCSFFIPPTGVEVLREEKKFVQDAVTLKQLEYAVLVDESGEIRYARGPDVVFPEPTEKFEKGPKGSRKFRAIELNQLSGVYILVTQSYKEGDKEVEKGTELWITGDECKFYFPRKEHRKIKYDGQEKHHAVAIPAGEARYVLNRLTGDVVMVEGPKMFLADPRKEVIVRRRLDPSLVKLLYPSNSEALEYNKGLAGVSSRDGPLSDALYRAALGATASSGTRGKRSYAMSAGMMPERDADWSEDIEESFGGEETHRKNSFTPPRTLVLDTKYDGAVAVNVWTNYAIQVVSKKGDRRVVVGPKNVLLAYDEVVEAMKLSTGKPKTTDDLFETAYLRVRNNKVGDIIKAETADLVPVWIKVSYRVDFMGDDHEKWFAAENYVKLLCDHLRSIVRNHVKQLGIRDFMANSVALVRDMVLGEPVEVVVSAGDGEEPRTESKRPGCPFDENNMFVYDVEVLDAEIKDLDIGDLMTRARHQAVEQAVNLETQESGLKIQLRSQEIKRVIDESQAKATLAMLERDDGIQKKRDVIAAGLLARSVDQADKQKEYEESTQAVEDTRAEAELERRNQKDAQRLSVSKQETEIEIGKSRAISQSMQDVIKAVGPDLIAAMQAHGDKILTAKMIEQFSVAGIINGNSISKEWKTLFAGMSIEHIASLVGGDGNGIASHAGAVGRKKLESARTSSQE